MLGVPEEHIALKMVKKYKCLTKYYDFYKLQL